MTQSFTVPTASSACFHELTDRVEQILRESGVKDGLCHVYCPHTTAGITINENADRDVVRDMLLGLERAYPDRPEFRHMEGNSSAHLRASAVGSSAIVPVKDGRLLLGRWQGIYLCEFDGPRTRTVHVTCMGQNRD